VDVDCVRELLERRLKAQEDKKLLQSQQVQKAEEVAKSGRQVPVMCWSLVVATSHGDLPRLQRDLQELQPARACGAFSALGLGQENGRCVDATVALWNHGGPRRGHGASVGEGLAQSEAGAAQRISISPTAGLL
jgi:hypothetical protein